MATPPLFHDHPNQRTSHPLTTKTRPQPTATALWWQLYLDIRYVLEGHAASGRRTSLPPFLKLLPARRHKKNQITKPFTCVQYGCFIHMFSMDVMDARTPLAVAADWPRWGWGAPTYSKATHWTQQQLQSSITLNAQHALETRRSYNTVASQFHG